MAAATKVGLITGASRGIGRETARRLAAAGYRVAVHCGRQEDAARAVSASLTGSGHEVFRADLADPDAAAGLVERVAQHYGRIDLLVNNAGVFLHHDPNQVDLAAWRAAWRDTLAVNLVAAADLAFCCLPHFPESGGKIINVSSRGAYRGEPESPAYGASKAGMNSLTQSLAKALGGRGIMVYGVAPGWVETDMAASHLHGPGGDAIRAQSPLHRAARPEEVANTIAFLAGEETDFLSGAIIDVNGASYFR
ncbi:SDR family NAD(P)-dependent oxidoreductase [Lentisalinibacter sediminis]|uniref:SDR family NAD(P)-dependent oxidoreductase n=1 Tax=Lentisalinibacter sediminis TaxID=2992237 RepID=UPI00386FC984